MVFRLVQPLKTLDSISDTPFAMVTLDNLLHSENAEFPIVSTVDGIDILDKLVQPMNAYQPIEVTPLGIVTLDKFLHS